MRGTHKGQFRGFPPTGKLVAMSGTSMWCFSNAKIRNDKITKYKIKEC
jgi:predicted ester cyclase